MSPGVGPMNTGIASWDMGYPGTSQQLLPSSPHCLTLCFEGTGSYDIYNKQCCSV